MFLQQKICKCTRRSKEHCWFFFFWMNGNAENHSHTGTVQSAFVRAGSLPRRHIVRSTSWGALACTQLSIFDIVIQIFLNSQYNVPFSTHSLHTPSGGQYAWSLLFIFYRYFKCSFKFCLNYLINFGLYKISAIFITNHHTGMVVVVATVVVVVGAAHIFVHTPWIYFVLGLTSKKCKHIPGPHLSVG